MDNKAIGEYLKRLRLRAGYKQSELGEMLNVTDKAISRWESGLGTPELGNLVAIAKLYDITVDDILNCNEAVFASVSSAPCTDGSAVSVTQSAPRASQEERTKSKILSEPWNKFRAIIFFAYILFGVYIGTYQYSAVTPFIAFYIIYSVLVLAVSVISLLSSVLPQKVYKILTIALDSLLLANTLALLLTVIIINADISSVFRAVSAWSYAFFALLFVMQLLYTLSQFTGDGKKVRLFNLCALGIALAMLVLAIAFTAIYGADTLGEEGIFEFIGFAVILSALAAVFFALGQIFSKFINVFTDIVMAVGAAFPFISYGFAAQNLLELAPVYVGGIFTPLLLAIVGIAPFSTVIGWLCESNKGGLIAVRITVGIAAVALIPFICYAADMFAVNVYFEWTSLAAAAWLTIAVTVAVIAGYVRAFKPELIIKKYFKRGRNSEI